MNGKDISVGFVFLILLVLVFVLQDTNEPPVEKSVEPPAKPAPVITELPNGNIQLTSPSDGVTCVVYEHKQDGKYINCHWETKDNDR